MLYHRHAYLACLGRREIVRYPKIQRQLKEISLKGNDYTHGKIPSLRKLIMENMIFSGAKISNCVWLLDQGRFQLQSWLPRTIIDNQQRLNACMSELVVFADIVVIFRCDPSLVVSRVKERGDYCSRNKLSNERGFSSLLDMSEYDYNLAAVKLQTALASGSESILIDLSSKSTLPSISAHSNESNNSDLRNSNNRQELINKVVEDFLSWWVMD